MIDVVIPTRNRGELITDTLTSLRASDYSDFRVLVVGQSENRKTAEVVEQFTAKDERFTYIHTPTKGIDVARNVGIQAGHAPIIAFTDDDCRVAEDWVGALVAEYERDPSAWGVLGRVISGHGESDSHQQNRLQQVLPMALQDFPERRVFEGNRFNLGFGHGANMSFARFAFEKVGLFDELLGVGAPLRSWPERDFGYRVLAAGGRIVYSPEALVFHYHWRGWSGVRKTCRNYAIGTGAAVGKYLHYGDWGAVRLLLE